MGVVRVAAVWLTATALVGLLALGPINLLDRAAHARDDGGGTTLEQRLAAIRRLAESDNQIAAVGLANTVRESAHVELREEAARSLGGMQTQRAPGLIVELIAGGGPRVVRGELGRSVLRHEDGVERIVRRLASEHDDELGRNALVTALAEGTGDRSRKALELLALSDTALERVAAYRALTARRDVGPLTHALALIALSERDDVDTLIAALDALFRADADALGDADLHLERLATHDLESISSRALHLQRRLAWLRDTAERERVRGGEYARPGPEPDEPRFDRQAIDEVWSFDTTASQRGRHFQALKDKISARIRASLDTGADVRIGFVLYRDDLRDANQRRKSYRTYVMPLTHDLPAVWHWLDAAAADGVDSQGQCISAALNEGLSRMNWRWDARRRMHVIGQKMVDRPERCARLTALHCGHDQTTLRVYTEHAMTDALRALARGAGTTLERFE